MHLPTARRRSDADVIRARLRALLAAPGSAQGWLPDDDLDPPDDQVRPPAAAPLPDAAGSAVPGGRHRRPGSEVRLDPGRTGARALWAAGLLAALILAAWTWMDRPRTVPASTRPLAATAMASPQPGGSRAAGSPASAAGRAGPEPAAASGTVVVSVVGLVVHPGLVTVPAGARVADAVAAAGGLLPEGDAASVNLAEVVSDGQQITVGTAAAPAGAAPSGPAGPVNLNTAGAAELDGLPGVGPVLAQRIIDYRQQHGRFRSIDQLDDVPGIGPALYSRLAGQVRV